jgi:hypothetical protein
MSQVVSPASFEHVALPVSHVEARPARSCCQQAVGEALENAGSMGSIATVAMLMVGFAMGMTTAWLLFG